MFDCNGRVLKATYIETDYIKTETFEKNGVTESRLVGPEWKLLQALSNAINFTYELIETKNFDFGIKEENNNWTGAIGLLQRAEVDFAICHLSDTVERRSVIDFSHSYFEEILNFFTCRNEYSRSEDIFFLSPFDNEVWITLLFFILLVMVLLYILSPRNSNDRHWPFFFVLGTFINKGMNIPHSRLQIQMVCLLWCLACFFLISHYGDALAASTSISGHHEINTLEKHAKRLLEPMNQLLLVPAKSIVETFFEKTSLEWQPIYSDTSIIKKFEMNFFDEVVTCDYTMAFCENLVDLFMAKSHPNITLHKVEEPLTNLRTGIGFRKNFSCIKDFNLIIDKLLESGCMKIWDEELMWSIHLKKLRLINKDKPLYILLNDLLSTFALLSAGIILGILLSTPKLVFFFIKYFRSYNLLSSKLF